MNNKSTLIALAAALALVAVSGCSKTSNNAPPETVVETVTETTVPVPNDSGTGGDHGGGGHQDTLPTVNPAVPTSPAPTLHPTNGILTPTTLHPTDGILTPATPYPTNGILPLTPYPTNGILPTG